MKKNNIIIGLTLLSMATLFVGGSYFYKYKKAEKQKQTLEQYRKDLVKNYSPVYGDPNAPVEIVEFLDPECETCATFFPFVKEVMNQFPGKVKLVIRYAPFHQNSVFAVKILEATRHQNKYWETLSKLFEMQPVWGDHHNPKPMLIWTYLSELEIDTEQIKRDMESPEIMVRIQTDLEDVKTFNVKKTPTFFVNGKPLESFGYRQLFDAVKKEVENTK
ncbi:MAG: thioredoxin domain-containing protein [Leptospirales bacterium]